MTICLTIAPLENYNKIYVPQKCLVPTLFLPPTMCCGSWVKCALHDAYNDSQNIVGYAVCQIYQQMLLEQSNSLAFMDTSVTIGMEQLCFTTTTVLTNIESLTESRNVNSITLDIIISKDFLSKSKRKWNLQKLKESCKLLLQAYGLTANCRVINKRLSQQGIIAVYVKAKNCDESSFFRICEETQVNINNVHLNMEEFIAKPELFYSIGFETALLELNNLIERSKSNTHHVCLNALLIGPMGCGKTALMRYFVQQQNCNYFPILIDDVLGQYPGESESKIRELFDSVKHFVEQMKPSAPTIVHLEDCQLLCSTLKNETKDNGNTLRLCAQICSILDELNSSKVKIICVATTTDAKLLHKNLYRPGRFQHEIEIEPLTDTARKSLFKLMFNERYPTHEISQETLELLVNCTNGYVVADLASIIRSVEQLKLKEKHLTMSELLNEAIRKSKATSLRGTDVTIVSTNEDFKTIGGMEALKKTLKLSILAGIQHADSYRRFGLSLPKGILFYGPPGCAKTTIAKCLATEAHMTFIATSSAEVYSPYVGCAEKFIVKLFDTARKHAPALIFLDEIDTLVGCRSLGENSSNDVQTRILSTLLTEMDGISQTRLPVDAYILVVAATNRPTMIDDALLRPGRFDQLIHVPAPDVESRLSILKLYQDRMPFSNDCDLKNIAKRTVNFSGADICNLCQEAAMHAFQRDLNCEEISGNDFESVLNTLKPSLTKKQIENYFAFKKGKL